MMIRLQENYEKEKTSMKKLMQRSLSSLLTLAMVVSMLMVTTLAADKSA